MNSRLIAAGILCRILKDGQSLTVALDNRLQKIDSGKERAFIQALCYGVIRQYFRLDFILSRLLKKPLKNKDTDVKALLLIGLYQLKYMRVKPHAAVSETVAGLAKKTHYKSLVNGILRTYLRDQDDLEQQADSYPPATTAHPDWLIEQIRQSWPERIEEILWQNNQQPPMVLRVNLNRCGRENYLQRLKEQHLSAQAAPDCASAVVLQQAVNVEQLPGFFQGLVSVQDKAAQLAAGLLDLKPGQKVLDLCAAPGGKTAHILETESELSSLLAVDVDPTRLLRIKQTLQRINLQAQLRVGDATKPDDRWDGLLFDRILLDVPCSALGVVRRHPDIKLLRREVDIRKLQIMQRDILNSAWRMLATGGKLLYATCSILKQENEHQIQDFIQKNTDVREIPVDIPWGMARQYGWQLLPGDSDADGFYYALLQKIESYR